MCVHSAVDWILSLGLHQLSYVNMYTKSSAISLKKCLILSEHLAVTTAVIPTLIFWGFFVCFLLFDVYDFDLYSIYEGNTTKVAMIMLVIFFDRMIYSQIYMQSVYCCDGPSTDHILL